MSITRSFSPTGQFELTDWTEELLTVPNTWGLINELGIFRNEGVSQHTITVESFAGTLSVIGDKVRGQRNNVSSDDLRKLLSFPIPHFPLDDAIKPEDVQGKRAYGKPDAAETKDAVMARKIEKIRRNHAVTLETARAYAIVNGAIYAPNGTVVGDYYTSFGVTRKVVDYDMSGTTTVNIAAKGEEVIAHMQDNILTGENISGVVMLCSSTFFSALIAYPTVAEAYKYYTSTQEPLRQRLGGNGLYRRFEHAGILYIEYRGSYNGTLLIPAGDAYSIPLGTEDMFISYYGPANKMSLVNTVGEEAYMFSYDAPDDSGTTIQSESNALHLIRRPAACVRATLT